MNQQTRIAVVEDNDTLLKLLGFQLRNRLGSSCTVDLYPSVNDTELKKISSGIYDLLLLDLMLEYGYSGEQIIIKLRATEKTKCLPIVVLTAKTLEAQAIFCYKLGADDFIRKPFSPQELAARIKNQIERRRECNEHKTSKTVKKKS